MNKLDMLDMVDNLYKAETLAQLLCIVSEGLRDQPRLANALSEVGGQIEAVLAMTRRDLEARIEQEADQKKAA